MSESKYDALKLERQVCFPLYACSKEIIRRYKPFLDELDLTYTQYITMQVMWEKRAQCVKDLGQILYLDSGTLTPVLKKLEAKGYITRTRSTEDERSLIIEITEAGDELRDRAISIPEKMTEAVKLDNEDTKQLFSLLNKLLGILEQE